MIYLRAIKQVDNEVPRDFYPLSLRQISELDRLEFTNEVTMLAGDNGSGKTTLMELIAALLRTERVSMKRSARVQIDPFTIGSRAFRPEIVKRPRLSFFFLAEDFTRYIDARYESMLEQQRELERVSREYADSSITARQHAAMPFASELSAMQSMYAGELEMQSHGEGYIDFFGSRIYANGLYLLDEPEGALSYSNQYVLMGMMADAVKKGCQFIVATHSPVLLAYPDACIYEFRGEKITRTDYASIENVSFLKNFMHSPERFSRALVFRDDDE